MKKIVLSGLYVYFITFFSISIFPLAVCSEPVSVLVPSVPTVEIPEPSPQKNKKEKARDPEVDVLISMMEASENKGLDVDMPQMFALIIQNYGENGLVSERKDLLGDVEEIRYLDKRAWGANIGLEKPGLYQFVMEGKPRWDDKTNKYIQHEAKFLMPVLGVDSGWNLPLSTGLEIVPLTRPFGLTAPAIFAGKVLKNGKPCENSPVFMGYINSGKRRFPTNWHKIMEARSDAAGQFSFVLNQPGWWYCETQTYTDPLKGPDGEPEPVLKSAFFWLYVDGPDKKRQ